MFDYREVIERLSKHIKDYDIEEDSLLFEWLQNQSDEGSKNIKIDSEFESEGDDFIHRIAYVIWDLLSDGNAKIFCKKCDSEIPASDIQRHQDSLFNSYKGIDKKEIKRLKAELGLKGRASLPRIGGTIFYCSKSHELFRTCDWIT